MFKARDKKNKQKIVALKKAQWSTIDYFIREKAITEHYTIKLVNKEWLDKEQMGNKKPFPVTNLPCTCKDKKLSALRNNFRATKKFLSSTVYFLNVVKYFWPCWNMQIYEAKFPFWPWWKKMLQTVKNFWTLSKYFCTITLKKFLLKVQKNCPV